MFGFSKDQLEQNKQEIAAMKDSIMSAMRDMMGHVATENAITRKMVSDFVAEEKAKIIMDERTVSQQDVIESGGGDSGAAFSIRVNTTLKRLEYINKASATDGDGNEWPDDQWLPVLRGDFVEYTP